MSSWLPSLFNPNHSRDPDSDYDNPTSPASSSPTRTPRTAVSGVKDDLSTVFRGVAAFLAPREGSSSSAVSSPSSDAISGIKNDLAEIQGSLKSGLSLISSKLTSNFFQFQGHLDDYDDGDEVEEEEEEEEEEEDAVGITEEVVDLVRKLSTRPELWIGFPLSLADDFDMSDHQRDHAASIEFLVPELVTLRKKISSQISEGNFWLIYFILSYPIFSEEDLKLLATPQVVEARETLVKKLQNTSNTMQEKSDNQSDSSEHISGADESDMQHKNVAPEIVCGKKPIDNMSPERHISEEETGSCTFVDVPEQSENEKISFSDLEDDDGNLSEKMLGSRLLNGEKGETSDWIRLNENSGGHGGKKNAGLRDEKSESDDSNDWLAVDDNDSDLGAI